MGSRRLLRLSTLVATTGLVVAMAQPVVAQPSLTPAAPDTSDGASIAAASTVPESPTGLYIVRLAEPSLATYPGGIPGLAPTSPRVTGAAKLDVASKASTAYLGYLSDRQTSVREAIERELGRKINVRFSYRNVINGFAVQLTAEEAGRVASLPGVAEVVPDEVRELTTDTSHGLIGSFSIWNGETGSDVGTRGEGVIVGLLDTGINPHHPSFAAVSPGDGYVHTNPFGSGNFVGVCDPSHPNHEPICNDKLIGAWNFHPSSPNAQDADGHGSHVASTIAGNIHKAEFTVGNDLVGREIQGVAPRANIISYLVCFPTCPTTSSVAAVNQAIADGVDVLNYSISGSDNPWNDLVDQAFLEAYQAGIFVAAAAGNDGPGAGTVAHTGPWNAAVAASTHERVIGHTVDVFEDGAPVSGLTALPAAPGDGAQLTTDITAPIRWAGTVSPGNQTGCSSFPAGSFAGAVALIQRGTCTFPDKLANAVAAGAVAVVFYNNVGGPPIAPGGLEGTTRPAVMIDNVSGEALVDLLTDPSTGTVTARLNSAVEVFLNEDWEDVVAGFSSRGPSSFEVLAPTFTMPGVNILAAFNASGGDPVQYGIIQGTSMASPHGAGAAALLKALHPDWSPAEIRSALAGTANPDVLVKEDGVTPADPFDQGSGRVDLSAAARVGLVMHETYENFLAANPAAGGDPKALNVPSMVSRSCPDVCTFTRTVRSVADTTATYTAVTTAADGVTVTVTPSEFTIAPNGTQEITVTVDVTDAPKGDFVFGDVRLVTDDTHGNGLAIASVHYPVVVIPVQTSPSISVQPAHLESSQAPDQQVTTELVIRNDGNATLHWNVAEPGAGSLPVTVTHSASDVVISGNAVACSSDGGITTVENGYLRQFRLSDFGVTGDFEVTSVSFGVESATAQTIRINLYRMINPAGPFAYSNFELLGFTDHLLPATTTSVVTVPVSVTVPAGSTLVMEIDAADLAGVGRFFMGSNGLGQTAPSYLRSASCGLPNPTDTAAIGFPGFHMVMSVTGLVEGSCDAPHDTPWFSMSTESGSVPPGGSQTVEVTFDSTGLTAGQVLEAALCLESNDPVNPATVVPVTLSVEDLPVITVTPAELEATQPAGTVGTQTLRIGNAGTGPLEWRITETEATVGSLGLRPEMFQRTPMATGGDRAMRSALADVADLAPLRTGASVSALPTDGSILATELAEGFEDITTLPGNGWVMINNSSPVGFTSWYQGIASLFPAHDGPPDSYIAADFENTDLIGTISNWLITPVVTLRNGDTLTFWTRSIGSSFPDRLEVRMSTAGASTNVGNSATSVGDFTHLLLSINPNLEVGGYPDEWTRFEITIEGLDGPATGRLAFRYFVTDSGFFGSNGDYIGIDTVEYTSAHVCDNPTDISWLSVSPAAGTTAPGDSSDVTVTFDATGLAPGEYEALLCVDSNDPHNPRITVPVTLTVVEETITCDQTITGTHTGPLVVSSGVTCLAEGARVIGPVQVKPGAGLIATGASVIGPVSSTGASVLTFTDSSVTGPLSTSGATVVDITGTSVTGPLSVTGSTGTVVISGNKVIGPVSVTNNITGDTPTVVAGNSITGPLSCSGNVPPPVNNGVPNQVLGPKAGQCSGL